MRTASRELREIVEECPANFAREEFVHRRDRAGRLIQRHTFDAIHRKKDGRQPDALAVGLVDLPDKMVKRIQIDSPQRHAGRIDVQKLAPDFLLGRV